MNLDSLREMTPQSAIEAEITKLEAVKTQLSKLIEGSRINSGTASICLPKMEVLSPIVEKLNTVIQQLKIAREEINNIR